jgi:Cu+-exporting ATPase
MNPHTLTRHVPGMNCQGCVKRMREAIQALDADAEVIGTPAEKRLDVTTTLDAETLDRALDEAGFPSADEVTSDVEDAAADEPTDTQTPDAPVEKKPATGSEKTRLAISGMTCASCVKTVQQALERTANVDSAAVNFGTHTAEITGSAEESTLISAVQDVGYDAAPIVDMREAENTRADKEAREYKKRLKGSVYSLVLAVPLMASMFFFHPEPIGAGRLYWLVIGALTLAVMAFPGRHFFTSAWKSFKHHQANMDTLVAMGTGTAWLYSMVVVLFASWLPEAARGIYFEASAMVIGLILLGNAMELRARGRTSDAL